MQSEKLAQIEQDLQNLPQPYLKATLSVLSNDIDELTHDRNDAENLVADLNRRILEKQTLKKLVTLAITLQKQNHLAQSKNQKKIARTDGDL